MIGGWAVGLCWTLIASVAVSGSSPGLAGDGTSDDEGLCHGTADTVVYTDPDEMAAGRLGMLEPLPTVALPPPDEIDFSTPPVDDPSWRMYWRGLTWLVPLADDPDHADLAVAYATAFQAQVESTAADVAGWDEGTNLRRLQALMCIVSRPGIRLALDRLVEQTIDAAMDPARYPNVPWPNNHVIMINRALIAAGDVMHRPDLVEFGLDRLANDWRIAWSPEVFDLEQSSAYVANNIALWAVVADGFEAHGRASEAEALRGRLEIARQGLRLLMTPSGALVPFGDSSPIVPGPELIAEGPLGVVDPVAGIAAGRTTWDDDAIQWTLRFGPPRSSHGHGHADAMSVTWAVGSHNILVDPGNFSYGRNQHADWDHNPSAHNVAIPTNPDLQFITDASSPLVAHSSGPDVERYTVMSIQFGIAQVREIMVFRDSPVLVVVDRVDGDLVQSWHLDPTWTPDGDEWRSADGSVLRVVSTATAAESFAGDARGGWVFPRFGVAEPAEQVMLSGSDVIVTAWALGDVDVELGEDQLVIDGTTYQL